MFDIRPRSTDVISIVSILFVLAFSQPVHAFNPAEKASNNAAQIKILACSFEKELTDRKAPSGKIFVVCETEWQNIHPKQKAGKDKLEGNVDRTMGVGGLADGKKAKNIEYVDMDVAYKVRKLQDHIYLLADGIAFALHDSTESIPGGFRMDKPFTIAKQGESKQVKFVFLVPEGKENMALQMFDYSFGHVTLPIQGSLLKARGSGEISERSLGQVRTNKAEFAAHALDFRPEYSGKSAPAGWRYAVVEFSGKSLSGGNIQDIVQFKPDEYFWLTTDGGYLYYCSASSTALDGLVRFTPEIYQYQELAFLVPESANNFKIGIRVHNQVLHLDLTDKPLVEMPQAIATHKDGDFMEIMLLGMRREKGKTIADLGIRSLYDRGGLEIQIKKQFILLTGNKEHKVDNKSTATLLHRPPKPFIIPPGELVRFELAFDTAEDAAFLRFRGYRSEGQLKL